VDQPYARQLAQKRARVEAALAPGRAASGAELLPVVAAPAPEGYRVQTKLVVRAARRGLVLGLYRPGTHEVRDACGCPLHAAAIRRALPILRAELERAQVPIHGPGRRGLRYVLVRASLLTRRLMVTLVASALAAAQADRLARALARRLPLAGLALNENATSGNEILGPRTRLVHGAAVLAERYGRLVLAAGPTAFVQANTVMAGRIYRTIATAAGLTGRERVLDLYAGVGGIALTLAPRAAAVLGVEEVAAAVGAARRNARRNRLPHARFAAGLVEERVRHLAPGSIDLVSMNPPRKGCGAGVARALAALGAPRLLYLSCSPESFARDAEAFAGAGYALTRVQPFDLLPQTEHVELLGSFARRD
jgi:23S rRNA (uracil1939-C5)-methyltransferase